MFNLTPLSPPLCQFRQVDKDILPSLFLHHLPVFFRLRTTRTSILVKQNGALLMGQSPWFRPKRNSFISVMLLVSYDLQHAGRPGSSEVPHNPLTRWDVSSIPANGIFLTKKLKTKIKMPNWWRTIKSLVHKIRLHGRRGKGMGESFSREKLRHAPQREGG